MTNMKRLLIIVATLCLSVPALADGSFGRIDTTGHSALNIHDGLIRGSEDTADGSGTVDSLVWIVDHTGSLDSVRGFLIRVLDSVIIDSTASIPVSGELDGDSIWMPFLNNASIVQDSGYVAWLFASGNGTTASLRVFLSGAGPFWRASATWPTFPTSPVSSITKSAGFFHCWEIEWTSAVTGAGQVIMIPTD